MSRERVEAREAASVPSTAAPVGSEGRPLWVSSVEHVRTRPTTRTVFNQSKIVYLLEGSARIRVSGVLMREPNDANNDRRARGGSLFSAMADSTLAIEKPLAPARSGSYAWGDHGRLPI